MQKILPLKVAFPVADTKNPVKFPDAVPLCAHTEKTDDAMHAVLPEDCVYLRGVLGVPKDTPYCVAPTG